MNSNPYTKYPVRLDDIIVKELVPLRPFIYLLERPTHTIWSSVAYNVFKGIGKIPVFPEMTETLLLAVREKEIDTDVSV